jgi:hypothetical protein
VIDNGIKSLSERDCSSCKNKGGCENCNPKSHARHSSLEELNSRAEGSSLNTDFVINEVPTPQVNPNARFFSSFGRFAPMPLTITMMSVD